ncbi:MAG: hypothetical protein RIR00_1927 [Pseudomonadota bacterium]|jgi:uncharacterized protein (UPF0276 family)
MDPQVHSLPAAAGLGFRRELIPQLLAGVPPAIEFFEIAPENWADLGGRSARQLRAFSERYPFVCHGLSLSLGGSLPLDMDLLQRIRRFMREHGSPLYTEHLSWCSDDGQLYDLLPLPCTHEAVRWVAGRIRQVQDVLGQRIGIENASYYVAPPGAEMDEAAFIRAVVEEADCLLHLDVNNIYVNSRNFGFDPLAFLQALPLERSCYVHVAGHYVADDGLIIDTHGADVIDPVWALLSAAYARTGRLPTCLERDFHIPDLAQLNLEVETIARLQQPWPEATARMTQPEVCLP